MEDDAAGHAQCLGNLANGKQLVIAFHKKILGVKKSSPAVYRCVVYGFMIQEMRKNARKKFGCRGKLPRFSPLAPEAAVREKARSKPLKYSLLRSNKNYAQDGCPAHSLQLRVQKPLTAL